MSLLDGSAAAHANISVTTIECACHAGEDKESDGGGAADDGLVLAAVARVELSENAPAVRAVDAVADGEAARVRAQRRTRTTGSPGRYSSLS